MDQNGFFRWVWRFNALLLALGGVFILAMADFKLVSQKTISSVPD